MDKTINEILAYTNKALNHTNDEIIISDDKRFYMVANENGLSGIIYSVIKKENITDQLYQRLTKDFYAYLKQDSLQLELINLIKELFTKNEIKHAFLKGSHLKKLYENSYLRAMGDIDILVDKTKISLVHKLFKDLEFKLISRSPNHDVFSYQDMLDVEIHPGFTDLENRLYQPFLDLVFKYLNDDNSLNHTYEFVYLNYHLAKHFYSGGIGLRSLLDIGIYLKSYQDLMDEELLIKLANMSDSLIFVKTMIKLNEELFKINNNFMFMKDFKLDEELVLKITNYIARSGIHGWGNNFNSFDARVLSSKNKKGGKVRLVLRRMFPTFKEMKSIYPSLKVFFLLLPFYYLIRLFKLTFIRGKKNYKKLVRISEVKDLDNTKELFNKIGL